MLINTKRLKKSLKKNTQYIFDQFKALEYINRVYFIKTI